MKTRPLTPAQAKTLIQASACGAPIAAAKKIKTQSWRQSVHGQTHSPAKLFIDLRNGRKISLGGARTIIRKYARQAKHE